MLLCARRQKSTVMAAAAKCNLCFGDPKRPIKVIVNTITSDNPWHHTLLTIGALTTTESDPYRRQRDRCRACRADRRHKRLLLCYDCLMCAYCDVDCQRRDWRRHRSECDANIAMRRRSLEMIVRRNQAMLCTAIKMARHMGLVHAITVGELPLGMAYVGLNRVDDYTGNDDHNTSERNRRGESAPFLCRTLGMVATDGDVAPPDAGVYYSLWVHAYRKMRVTTKHPECRISLVESRRVYIHAPSLDPSPPLPVEWLTGATLQTYGVIKERMHAILAERRQQPNRTTSMLEAYAMAYTVVVFYAEYYDDVAVE